MSLFIVESPVKAQKIWGILKGAFPQVQHKVVATFGHVIDLPPKTFSIDLTTFEPTLEVLNKKQLTQLFNDARIAHEIYIGTDDDREGEAIGQNVKHAIEKAYPDKVFFRIRFNEITKRAILYAVNNPQAFNDELYQAQLARRELDRIIGYKTCPVLWKNVGKGLTAGRVQTCALMMLVEVEIQRIGFKPVPFWYMQTTFEDGTVAKSDRFDKYADACRHLEKLKTAKVQYIEGEDTEKKPPPPFNTSALIQAASSILGMPSERTMEIAQELFTQGLISYHRTTSIGLNPGFMTGVHKYLSDMSGEYVEDKPRIYPQSGAHEGIRPTNITALPSDLTAKEDTKKLYQLIWARVLGSQAKPAIVRDQTVLLVDNEETVLASGSGKKMVFEGHYRVSMGLFKPKMHTMDETKLNVTSNDVIESQTEAPRRWSEAEFIRHLEDVGVGRPSTYAATIQTLLGNNYARRSGKSLVATLRGVFLAKFIYDNVKSLTAVDFTADMEKALDDVESGKSSRVDVLSKYWQWLEPTLSEAWKHWLTTADKCDKCGKELEVWFDAKFAPYLWCPCDTYYSASIDTKMNIVRFVPGDWYEPCACGAPMKTQSGKYGMFAFCTKCDRKYTIL